MEKLESPLPVFFVDDDAPQGLDASVELLLAALLQSMPALAGDVYNGVVVVAGEIILPIGFCWFWENDEPIPGLAGVIAGNAELSEPIVLSGVMVLTAPSDGVVRFVGGGGDTGGVDHEKAATGDAVLADDARLAAGREGSVVADADAFPQPSPPSISEPVFAP